MKIDMLEATRLTRAGRLGEAMALLRGGPAAAAPTAAGTVIDLHPPGSPARAWAQEPATGARAPVGSGRHLHVGATGRRSYDLHLPAQAADGQVPLLVMLHGCTQDAADFAAGTRMNALADAHGVAVAWPEQPRSANGSRCWNWFRPEDQGRDGGEPALIAGITRDVLARHRVDPARVYIAGLSAGGAAAVVAGTAYPELYAAVGVHSGLARGTARDAASAFQAMAGNGLEAPADVGGPRPAIVFHGDRDTTVHERNAQRVLAQLRGGATLAASASSGTSAGGVRYTRTDHRDAHGRVLHEHWRLHGAGHAWSGGSADGSHTDPRGPDASAEMLRFFLQHRNTAR
jgi:poly(hydroxyalkanoate) depolymerase family esterase